MNILSSRKQNKIQPSYSIIIPVYNQTDTIIPVVKNLRNYLNDDISQYEIIIINDGSSDDTDNILKEYQEQYNFNIISYKKNMGKGFAVKSGILRSTGKNIMFLDGDLDISINTLHTYFNELKTHDVVIASKRHPDSEIISSFKRNFLSKCFNLFVTLFTGINVSDTQSGLKAGNGQYLRFIFKHLSVKRYAFDVEFLAMASLLDLKIKELPIHLQLTGDFKLRDIFKMFMDILGVSYRLKVSHWYQKKLSTFRSLSV